MIRTLVRIITKFCNKHHKRDLTKEEKINDHKGNKKVIKFENNFSTIDRTPLSKNTILTINLFKNVPQNINTPENGEIFYSEDQFSKKLTRYEEFINFVIKHNTDSRLPKENFIGENCRYENELVFTKKIIQKLKEEGLTTGDLIKNDKGRYFLARKEKYE